MPPKLNNVESAHVSERSNSMVWVVFLALCALVSFSYLINFQTTSNQSFERAGFGHYETEQIRHASTLRSTEFTQDGRFLITRSSVGEAILWDAVSGQKIRDILSARQPNPYYGDTSVRTKYYGLANGTSLMLFGYGSIDESQNKVAWLEMQALPEAVPRRFRKPPRRFELAGTAQRFGVALPNFADLSHDRRYLIAQGQLGLQVWDVASGKRIFDRSHKLADLEQSDVSIRRQYQREPWWLGNSVGAIGRMAIYAQVRPDGKRLHWIGKTNVAGEGTQNAFSPNGKHYVTSDWTDTGSADEDVILWDVANREPLRKTLRPYSDPQHIQFTSDGRFYLERGDSPKDANLRRAMDAKLVHKFTHPTNITARAMAPNGLTCLLATEDGFVHKWSLGTGSKQFSIDVGRVHVMSLEYRHDGKECLVGTKDGIAITLKLPSGKGSRRFMIHES